MVENLWEIFKAMLLIFGIIAVGGVIISMILEPFKKKQRKKTQQEFLLKLQKIANECVEEIKKEEENKKKTAKKPRKSKEN